MGRKEQKKVMGADRLSSERWQGEQRVIERWSRISPPWEGAAESWLLFELEATSPRPSLAKKEPPSLTGMREMVMPMLMGNSGGKAFSFQIPAACYGRQMCNELCVPQQNIIF